MGKFKELYDDPEDDEPSYPESPGYVRDSDTSKAAAKKTKLSASSQRAHIAAFIADSEIGVTCDEVEVYLGYKHQTASARIREGVLGGLFFDTGHRRKTRSGSPARIYKVVEKGE